MLFWCHFEHYNQHLTFLPAAVTTGLLKVYQTLFGASAYNKPVLQWRSDYEFMGCSNAQFAHRWFLSSLLESIID